MFYIFTISKADRKFQCEFNVELHGMDDDRELMARYNVRREELGLAEFDRNMSRLREAVKKTLVDRSPEEDVSSCILICTIYVKFCNRLSTPFN